MPVEKMASTGKTVTFKIPDKEPSRGRDGGGTLVLPKTPHPKILKQESGEDERHQTVSQASPGPRENEPTRPHSRPSSEQNSSTLLEAKQTTLPARTRHHHVAKTRRRAATPADTARAINAARERTNSASRENTRALRYSVVKLRESLLRVEEEVKQTTRGKHTLELAVQDVRKAISVNQQSLSTQQKKTRAEVVYTSVHMSHQGFICCYV